MQHTFKTFFVKLYKLSTSTDVFSQCGGTKIVTLLIAIDKKLNLLSD